MDHEHVETSAIHAGQEPDPETGAVMSPIYASSTFARASPDEPGEFGYSRTANPTRADLETNVAALEGADHCRAFGSGMGAINAALTLLDAGSHIVAPDDVYGGTYRILTGVYRAFDVDVTFVDTTDLEAVAEAMRRETSILWLESPTNPLLRIVDIAGAAEIAHEGGALCVVDNTFATPYLQRPLDLGADVVVHSMTKYLGGHSDVLAGAVVTDDPEVDDRMAFAAKALGATLSPFECFLVLRGTKTLPIRMDRHCANARELASWLDDHPDVDRVYYPGLGSHPGHDLAAAQMDDFGGMVSFELEEPAAASGVVSNTEVFTLAGSLGGVESLIAQPAEMSHAAIPREERLEAGITDGLVRASVGIEHVDDLQRDLESAIRTALE